MERVQQEYARSMSLYGGDTPASHLSPPAVLTMTNTGDVCLFTYTIRP